MYFTSDQPKSQNTVLVLYMNKYQILRHGTSLKKHTHTHTHTPPHTNTHTPHTPTPHPTPTPPNTHTPLLVKRVNWGYLYTPIQTGTFECGYTPAYWGYTKYECDYTPITWGYPNIPSIGDMLLNAFIWHFRSHAGNAQMGTSPVGSVSTFPLAESDVCPRFTRFTNAHTHTHTHPPV